MKSKDTLPEAWQKAFKDADIRGTYPDEINATVAYRVARAFVFLTKSKTVIVARDMRESSPELARAFIAGVRDSGANALDIGLVDTPALYYVSGTEKLPGVVITASHNPRQYNGMKLVYAEAIPLTNASGLKEIKTLVSQNDFKDAKSKGKLIKKSYTKEYLNYSQKRVPLNPPRRLKIVVDAGNGMSANFTPLLCKKLPIDVTPLFFTLDGTFPNRDSNPTLAKNQTAIKKTLREGDYDFGISFDGDADRVAFFDEKGQYLNSAVVGALMTSLMLEQQPKSSFVYTVFTSRIYEETIKNFGGKAIRARVGHAFIKEMMRKKDSLFACEHSAHFYFRDNFYTDSGILAFLYVARAFSDALKDGKTFSQMLKPFMKYHQTEEILVPVKDKNATLKTIADIWSKRTEAKVTIFDGVNVETAEYWFTVKKSVTEDALKFVVESPKKPLAHQIQSELLTQLQG